MYEIARLANQTRAGGLDLVEHLADGLVAVLRAAFLAASRAPQTAERECGVVDRVPGLLVPLDADRSIELRADFVARRPTSSAATKFPASARLSSCLGISIGLLTKFDRGRHSSMILHLTTALRASGSIGLQRQRIFGCSSARSAGAGSYRVEEPQDTTRIMEGVHA